ncbi:hypothetical protein MA20_07065 [Bradyrhizobium japonicum]|uniref:Uncharacterized protein n=1 Tax=Bradyrhizobium japonicum TaxID=375 RepID=A0A0A3Y0Y6_BRAJP|nr:hypothetical protein [Bradyrhizobium japonicum]KGT80362.1 hypothetical protein MA20_07065 [Bradyrhizobium japonicum]MCS3898651.1 hypothetical protein [Bradyrhizobium japonicum USDA 38]MCS3941704.1 hypothetical protein [Bradyrhizobium japonicum]MCW2225809.1 hypothetical protein [Bradyrhizobium japonicum]MCW2341020.1 hypothetical protein [Bradyrhizobium japonicum]
MSKKTAKQQLHGARADLAAAEANLRVVPESKLGATDTPTSFDAWRRERDSAVLEVERLSKLIERLEAAMIEDTLREQQAALRKRTDAQQQANEVLAQRIQKEGQAAIDVLLTLARDIAAAEIVDAEINTQLRDDADRIVGADMLARYRPPAPRETISETKTSLWVFAANGNLVGDQDEVQEWADGRGFLVGAPGHRTQCVRRGFRSIEYIEAEPHQHPEPFYGALRLSGITSGPA